MGKVRYKGEMAVLKKEKSTISMPADAFRRDKAVSERILQAHSDYLFADERKALKAVAEERDFLMGADPEKIESRILKIRVAGVPPIFKESFETKSGFPRVDFILQLVSGNYTKRFRAQAAEHKIKKRLKEPGLPARPEFRIEPSTVHDVLLFRTYAFDGLMISPHVTRETEFYVAERFDIQTPLNRYRSIFKYLEKALRGFRKLKKKEQKTFRKGDTLDFINERMWHTRFAPGDRILVVNDFVERVMELEEFDRELISRICAVFPRETEGLVDELTTLKRTIKEADKFEVMFKTNEFGPLKKSDFKTTEGYNKFSEWMLNRMVDVCEKLLLNRPYELFYDQNKFARQILRLNPEIFRDRPDFLNTLLRFQLAAVERMPDKMFKTNIAPSNKSYSGKLSHISRMRRKHPLALDLINDLIDALNKRVASLRPLKGPFS